MDGRRDLRQVSDISKKIALSLASVEKNVGLKAPNNNEGAVAEGVGEDEERGEKSSGPLIFYNVSVATGVNFVEVNQGFFSPSGIRLVVSALGRNGRVLIREEVAIPSTTHTRLHMLLSP